MREFFTIFRNMIPEKPGIPRERLQRLSDLFHNELQELKKRGLRRQGEFLPILVNSWRKELADSADRAGIEFVTAETLQDFVTATLACGTERALVSVHLEGFPALAKRLYGQQEFIFMNDSSCLGAYFRSAGKASELVSLYSQDIGDLYPLILDSLSTGQLYIDLARYYEELLR